MLRLGRVLDLTTLLGLGSNYLLLRKLLNEVDLQTLSQNNGLKLIAFSPLNST